MPLTPLDIVNKEFKHGFRGYSEDDVNEFLDEIVRDYEALIKENDELKENTSGMTERLEQYRKLEATLQNTLVIAQQTAEEVKTAARKEAELIVREAEARAEEIVRQAESRAREVETQLVQLRYESEKFRAQVKSLLESQLRLVSDASLAHATVET
ncbi:MAG: DivIVA domain-containing protein [Firmicutes bacterium]|jgi:cell division initiation protein|uniref:Septum formation initiator n=1 Tax=Sulfobacillus benefaciens TaxID=453960 RepID=A0A2T2X6V4_9FIRM|nr:DivIVA domain-containing protein [Bacillota bacterium]MCL5013821.1 DivIVA domain-containing protein [Bacillota bacterium]PSR30222.1 MAG: septum formation initiator [Sulfobacillus benefaciens]